MADDRAAYELNYNRQRHLEQRHRLNMQQAKSSMLRNLLICLREMFGTAAYVFVSCMASYSIYSQGLTYAALQASAELSGTGGLHLNPAITTGVTIAGKMSKPVLMIPMIFAQFIGCLIGAGFHRAAIPEAMYMAADVRRPFFTLAAYSNIDLVQLCFGEAVLTCILVTVFIRLFPMATRLTSTSKAELRNMKYIHALFVGLTFIAISGVLYHRLPMGYVNPFCVFGQMAVMAAELQRLDLEMTNLWKGHWIYWVGPILGAMVAGVIDRITSRLRNKSRKASGDENSPMA